MKKNKKAFNKIKLHYKKEAEEHGLDQLSTMPDLGKRQKEVKLILSIIEKAMQNKDNEYIELLDIGCGNGYTLSKIREKFPKVNLYGIDLTPEMVDLANQRKIDNCYIKCEDICNNNITDKFDLIFTERTIQNILDWGQQEKALINLHKLLKPKGYLLLIEGFTDGHKNCNLARQQLGLELITPPYHNLLIDKKLFKKIIKDKFSITDYPEFCYDINFLSSYDFIRLVIHPIITKGKWIRNTELVKFLGEVIKPIGNYSRTQAYVLKKLSN